LFARRGRCVLSERVEHLCGFGELRPVLSFVSQDLALGIVDLGFFPADLVLLSAWCQPLFGRRGRQALAEVSLAGIAGTLRCGLLVLICQILIKLELMIEVATLALEYLHSLVAEADEKEGHILKLKHEQVVDIEYHLWYFGL